MVLEEKEYQHRLIVGNVHLFHNPFFEDVKLHQMAMVLNFLKSLAQGALPIILTGDFNSLPESAPIEFVLRGKTALTLDRPLLVDQTKAMDGTHLITRMCAIEESIRASYIGSGSFDKPSPSPFINSLSITNTSMTPSSDFSFSSQHAFVDHIPPHVMPSSSPFLSSRYFPLYDHKLDLISAYASVLGEEPPFTHIVPDWIGTLDYIFVSKAHFKVVAALEIPQEKTPIPTEEWPSDHYAVAAELAWPC